MKILGFSGQKQSGKDTACQCIINSVREWDVVRIGFADALKEEVAKACGVTVEFIEQHKDEFRPILQWWGTDFRRKFHGDDYWLKQWLNRAVAARVHLIVVPDVRFKNEAALLRDFNAKIFRVVRFGLPDDAHKSETEMEHIEVDEAIPNNDNIDNFCSIVLSKFYKHYGNNTTIHTPKCPDVGHSS